MKLDKKDILSLKPSQLDQFRFYPSREKDAWKDYFYKRISSLSENDEWTFYYDSKGQFENLIGARISSWDFSHFNIKMGSISVICNENTDNSKVSIKLLIEKCLKDFKNKGIKFVSTRINGDNLSAIHIAEELGFKYYETVVWPVKKLENSDYKNDIDVRLMNKNDLERVFEIASQNTYQRSHFHCDTNFSIEKADSMHVKWIKTAWEKKDPIVVIEEADTVAGFFVFGMDDTLSKFMGYKYGRMKNLALDKKFRGRGLGNKLFNETIILMKKMGLEVIDSGYAIKNLPSAKLHALNSFIPVYGEVTFHLWL